jgi:hypothetical protein
MREGAWNRQAGRLTDVITFQLDKIRQNATINVGVLDPVAYTRCWNRPVPDFVEDQSCTVRARLGELVDGHDHWWSMGSDEVGEVVDQMERYALPFLERMHSPGAIEAHLEQSRDVQYLLPPETIYLVILKHERGDLVGACTLLARFEQKAIGIWKPKATTMLQDLGCRPAQRNPTLGQSRKIEAR